MVDRPLLPDVRRFFGFVRPYWVRAVLGLLAAVAVGMLEGVIPYLLKLYMDGLIGSGTLDLRWLGDRDIAFFPFLIVVFALVQSLFSYAANYLITWSGKRIGNDVKIVLFDHLLHADPAVFDKTASGQILLRYGSDADAATEGLLSNAKTLITRVVTSVFLVGLLFYISWILALVAMCALMLTVIPLNRVRKRVKSYLKDMAASGALVTTNYNEVVMGNRVIASYNLYSFCRERLRRTLSTLFRLNVKMAQRTSMLSLVMHFATSVGIAACVGLQGYLIVSGRITIGDFVAFITALLALYTPLKKIGNNFSTVQSCTLAIQRIMEVLDRKPTIVSPAGARTISGLSQGIHYQNVDFAYEPGRPVLRNITLEIPVGESIAFVGPSGGGKTTLATLLPRFYDVDAGSITIDGVDIRALDLTSLRDCIAIVFQDNFLFGGTIRENILLGKRDASDEEIAKAVKAACLDEFVESLADGLDTQVGERGTLLSGGQKQRLAIARAFIKDAPIVILDEATSALDTKSEAVVQQAIENLMVNKTVLIIAHRLSTVMNADRIVVLRDGEIVESGTHRDLMARGKIYASLYQTQLT
ncbi:MAG: ABC transporter ATP-binding protein/permease [Planctomycetes bacterium]|nr:ABC transporter ATP-binding protein/permease [Planctomycetota bacterium]